MRMPTKEFSKRCYLWQLKKSWHSIFMCGEYKMTQSRTRFSPQPWSKRVPTLQCFFLHMSGIRSVENPAILVLNHQFVDCLTACAAEYGEAGRISITADTELSNA